MAADRAINMALRVLGIGEVERDFRRVGDAGSKTFAEVKKAANGAALEVSDYTERLRRAAAAARQMAANTPALNKGSPDAIRTNRRDFILGAVGAEQERILKGMPDVTRGMGAADAATAGLGGSLARLAAPLAIAAGGLYLLKQATDPLIAAQLEHEKALSAFNATISLTGNRSAASAAEIRALGEAVAASSGQTEASALQAAAALAKIPGITKEGLQAALEAAAQLATVLGTDVASVVSDRVIPVFQALADRDMKALWKASEGLSDGLRVTIQDLAEAGRTAEAQQALVNGLTEAVGDGPGGLTSATNQLSASWRGLQQDLGGDLAGPASAGIRAVAGLLDWLRGKIRETGVDWRRMLDTAGTAIIPVSPMIGQFVRAAGVTAGSRKGGQAANPDPYGTGSLMKEAEAAAAAARVKGFQAKYGGGGRKGKSGGGRKGGGSGNDAQREAEQARSAADRIAEANADVVKSWELRVSEIEAKVGLEGAALEAVERQQEIEAAARRINTELIEKEVAAREKAAKAAGKQFDAARATAEVTAQVNGQQDAVRALAERYADAEAAIEKFNRRQSEAKAVLEGLKTPFEKLNGEVEKSIELLRSGHISAGDFDKRMDQLARAIGNAALEADEGRKLWKGFGSEVGRTLSDFVLRGGSALDVLKRLIELPLERLLYKNVEQPIARAVDKLFGVDEETNTAHARAGLPDAGKMLGASVGVEDTLPAAAAGASASVTALGSAADLAAQALARVTGMQGSLGGGIAGGGGSAAFNAAFADLSAGNDNLPSEVAQPLADVGTSAVQVGAAMQALVPLTGQFGGALGQVMAMLSAGGGGGGGGLLGSVLGIVGGAIGGGFRPSAGLVADVSNTMALNPGLFASGTDDLPIGRPFWVGENGREMMERTRGGQVRVLSNQRAHREAGGRGMPPIVLNVNIPERADPRRTASTVARGAQAGYSRASRKGLAAMGDA